MQTVPILAFDLTLLFQRIVDGAGNGAIYASLALALVMVFRVSGLLNFAQGEMAMLSTFITWALAESGLPIGLAIVVSMAIAFGIGALVEVALIRPVARSSPLAVAIVTIGLFLAINAGIIWHWGTDPKTLASPFPGSSVTIGGVDIPARTMGNLVVLAVVCTALALLLQYTKTGLAIRAVATNAESARLSGIRVGLILMVGWGLAAALGALSGALIAPTLAGFDAAVMQRVLILAFAAAVLGGLDNPVGAVVGGIAVGVAESLFGGYGSAELSLAAAFAAILVVLLLRPAGLFGGRVAHRV
jgi:branched-chain amino acid transport system permease protein